MLKKTPEREQDERTAKLAAQIPSLVTLRSRTSAELSAHGYPDEVINAIAVLAQATYEDFPGDRMLETYKDEPSMLAYYWLGRKT